jgi:hypothetical protein
VAQYSGLAVKSFTLLPPFPEADKSEEETEDDFHGNQSDDPDFQFVISLCNFLVAFPISFGCLFSLPSEDFRKAGLRFEEEMESCELVNAARTSFESSACAFEALISSRQEFLL